MWGWSGEVVGGRRWITSCESTRQGSLFDGRLRRYLALVTRFNSAISLYDEPVPTVIDTIKRVKRTLPRFSSSRTTIYTKKIERQDTAGLQALLNEAGVDEVVALDNMGREGETYLVSAHVASPRY